MVAGMCPFDWYFDHFFPKIQFVPKKNPAYPGRSGRAGLYNHSHELVGTLYDLDIYTWFAMFCNRVNKIRSTSKFSILGKKPYRPFG